MNKLARMRIGFVNSDKPAGGGGVNVAFMKSDTY